MQCDCLKREQASPLTGAREQAISGAGQAGVAEVESEVRLGRCKARKRRGREGGTWVDGGG